jgi:hypothetical protein
MGLFKQMKDMKNVVAAAPDMIEQANAMAAQSQQMAAAQQQAAAATGAVPGAPGQLDEATLAPIAGISIEQYAKISKQIGTQGLDDEGVTSLVIGQGLTREAWDEAYNGWNERFKGNTALAVHFGNIYAAS